MKSNLRLGLLAILPLIFATAMAAAPRPNIVMIMCDDLGYADVGFNGSTDIKTPNLDALAEAGTICSSGYVVHPFCGPSRMGLMTGRYPHLFGAPFNLPAFSDGIDKYNRLGVDPNKKLISRVLQEGGYRTGLIGKWHLGAKAEHHPNKRGFDEFYGFLAGGHDFFPADYQPKYERQKKLGNKNPWDYILPLEHNGKEVRETEYLTDGLSREACTFIEESGDKPFFLFLSYNAPHTPLQAKKEDMEHFKHITDPKRRTYAGMVHAVDRGVAKVVETLKNTDNDKSTLIIFLSDNGGRLDQGANNSPLRGSKGDTFEGGFRVPMFFHWPDTIPAGRVHPHPVSALDFYPTFAALAGAELPSDKKTDGLDISKAIIEGTDVRKGEMIYTIRHRVSKGDNPHHQIGGRRNQWKIQRGSGSWKLFDVEKDPGETKDLSRSHPEVLSEMVREMKKWAMTHPRPLWFDNLAQEDRWTDKNLPVYEAAFSLD
ncbi:sulfatase-like hydrolase/transferase [Haloferula sp.]|uniref:sulfatase-like hydrolase/transferase n=1 Tax=Haloferula sp. TaxID=2497595 RepID=UPI00329CF727